MGDIVVGVDGSAASAGALAWATRLARRSGLHLVIVRAWRVGDSEVDPARFGQLLSDARDVLERDWCAPCRDAAVPYEVEVLDEEPVPTLNAAAERRRADLLVVGARGVGGFAGLRLGRVALGLAHSATVPLAVVPEVGPANGGGPRSVFEPRPEDRPERQDGRCVVGVNGSQESAGAVGWLARHPAVFPFVDAVFSDEPFLEWVPPSDPRSWHRAASRSLDGWVTPLRAVGVDVSTDVVRDIHPVAALLQRAAATGADAIVVGAHPVGDVLGVRLGHASMQLLHHNHLATVIVPHEATATRGL